MKCYICDRFFYKNRKLTSLFNNDDNRLICDTCYNKYPLELAVENIMLDKYNAVVISMFKKNYRINFDAYFYEYNKIFKAYIKRKDYQILFLESIKFDDFNIELLDGISKLFDKNLIILTQFIVK